MAVLLPSQIINLTLWVLTLPTGRYENPTEIEGASLLNYKNSKYFTVNNSAVVFKAPVNGISTVNSNYPRTELRELYDANTQASWNMSQGIHIMYMNGSVTVLPTTVRKTVVAQIHGDDDDIVEFRCWTNSKGTMFDVFHNGMIYGILDKNYTLGKIYLLKVVATDSIISIFYNDMNNVALRIPSINDACYFKTGVYPQYYNKSSTEYSEARLYGLNVTHVY
jgi:hypothetical protein